MRHRLSGEIVIEVSSTITLTGHTTKIDGIEIVLKLGVQNCVKIDQAFRWPIVLACNQDVVNASTRSGMTRVACAGGGEPH